MDNAKILLHACMANIIKCPVSCRFSHVCTPRNFGIITYIVIIVATTEREKKYRFICLKHKTAGLLIALKMHMQ